MKCKPLHKTNWKSLFFSIVFLIILLEIGLRITGLFDTYSEKLGNGYVTYYDQSTPDWYHTWGPDQEVIYTQQEFQYTFKTNTLGLREKEFPKQKPDSVFRLICIGDSYTDGDGADYPNTYPRFLETKLNSTGKGTYQVLNAGVCGSDVFFMNSLLRDRLMSYNPDAVIYLLNRSDIDDVIFRGGKERFLADGSCRFRPAPWFHPAVRFSHVVRMSNYAFGIHNETLLNRKQLKQETENAIELLTEEVNEGKEMCRQKGIKCIVLMHPAPNSYFHQITAASLLPGFQALGQDIVHEDLSLEIDLIEAMQLQTDLMRYVQAFAGLQLEDYAWPINGHFNAAGYNIVSNIVYDEVSESDSTFFNLPIEE
jgi:hypothetical protein